MVEPMTTTRLIFLAGIADGLKGTVRARSVEEARDLGLLMTELVRELARMRGIQLPGPGGDTPNGA